MSRKDNLIKSKSIYTLRSKHTSVTNGTIYENDHVTIIPNDGIYDEDMPLFSESNFKFRIGRGNEERKKHSRSNWITNAGNEVWTLNNIPHKEETTEGKIVIRPNYSSLKDFAYYGSAVELLKATINDIIMRYPGGISYYRSEVAPKVKVHNDSNEYYLVSNEFNIDFWTPAGVSPDEVDNPMRILSTSYMNYEDGNGNDIGLNICITGDCLNSIIGKVSFENRGGGRRSFGGESDIDRNNDDDNDNDDSIVLSKGGNSEESDGGGEIEKPNEGGNFSGNEVDSGGEPFYWTAVTIICYSGFSETNYLPNVTIPGVRVFLVARDSDGNVSTQYDCGETDERGRCVVPRKYLGALGSCINWFSATGSTDCTSTTNSLNYDCYKATSAPVLNLYYTCKTQPPQQNHFPYIAYAKNSSNGNPLTDVDITFYAYLILHDNSTNPDVNANKPFYTDAMSTNPYGNAKLEEIEDWHYGNGGQIYHLNGYTITEWYAKAVRNGIELTSPRLGYYDNEYTFYFDVDEPNSFNIITVNGIVGANTSIGAGHEARIMLYDEQDRAKVYTGLTDNAGSLSLTRETFESLYDMVPVAYNVMITYNEEQKTGTKTNFVPNVMDYQQTIYFKDNGGQDHYTLTGYVYTQRNGVNTPLANQTIVFSAMSRKNVVFTTQATSSVNGIACVNLPGSNWQGSPQSALDDVDRWTIWTTYGGSQVFGVNGVNYLANNQYSDTIYLKGGDNWKSLTVHVSTTCQVNGSYNAPGAFVTVYASTQVSERENWNYTRNGTTDSSGYIVFFNDNGWTHINGTPTGDTNNLKWWKSVATYNGVSVTGNVLSIAQTYQNLTVECNLPPTPPPTVGCNTISVPEGFFIYLDGNGKKHLLTTNMAQTQHSGNVVIRPKSAFTESFWNSLDDFEAVILNRYTKPVYKAKLETPYIEDNIHLYKMKTYAFPTVDNIGTPDLTTGRFNGYLSSLMRIAEYYDEYEADNLWRMMTHESIKNLDWTFIRKTEDGVEDLSDFDYTRMQAMLRTEARIFDDIKRYADNIKSMNCITYDGKNNVPDYFLSDVVELNGFEPNNIDQFTSGTTDEIYEYTRISGYTGPEASSEFMRRLALSSKYIMSMKGTRRGIEALLGMFGYEYGADKDYTIDEYVAIATNFPKYKEATSLRILGVNEYLYTDDNVNFMAGYPVEVICPGISEPTENDYYLVPWVDNGEKYINDIYFQEKGGWQRTANKEINLGITTATKIEEEFGVNIYGETEPYMYYVNDLEELKSIPNSKVFDGMICYVTNISDIYSIYKTEADYHNGGLVVPINESQQSESQESTESDRGDVLLGKATYINNPTTNVAPDPNKAYSHYFVLKNTALSNYIGFVHNDLYNCYGWKNILKGEFKDGPTTADGLMVLYLESLELNNKGNNPHCGFGNYDEGDSYISKLNFLFGAALETGEYDYLKETDITSYNKLLELGFEIKEKYVDNKKCRYFKKDSGEMVFGKAVNPIGSLEAVQTSIGYTSSLVFMPYDGVTQDVTIDENEYTNYVNPEPNSNNKTEESAAYSIVNVKNMLITFNTRGNEYFKKYLEKIVFKYLNEMIPSTTILRYKFKDNGVSEKPTITPVDTTNVYNESMVIVGDMATVSNEGDTLYMMENNDGLANNSNNNER